MLSGPWGSPLCLTHAPSGSSCPAAPLPGWVRSRLLPAGSPRGQVAPRWHLFGMLPMPGCSEWAALWAHPVLRGAGRPRLALAAFLRAPGSTGHSARSGRPSAFRATEGSCVWGGGTASTFELVWFFSPSDHGDFWGRDIWPPPFQTPGSGRVFANAVTTCLVLSDSDSSTF